MPNNSSKLEAAISRYKALPKPQRGRRRRGLESAPDSDADRAVSGAVDAFRAVNRRAEARRARLAKPPQDE